MSLQSGTTYKLLFSTRFPWTTRYLLFLTAASILGEMWNYVNKHHDIIMVENPLLKLENTKMGPFLPCLLSDFIEGGKDFEHTLLHGR